MDFILEKIQLYPMILDHKNIISLIYSLLLKLTIDALLPTFNNYSSLKPQPKRMTGTKRVIEYLQMHAVQ
ncbi:MAG: hypothetical protein MJK15_04155 [Colwellia sp.]|nr:hypothetical protein [Colwellia sp.]